MANYSLDISPEERLKYRKEAYGDFANLQPALDTSQKIQRQQFANKALEGNIGARSEDISKGLGAAATGAAQMLPGQKAQQDALAMQGAGYEQDIIGGRQAESLKQFSKRQKSSEDEAARAVANRAFQLGMEAKQLVFHDKAKVADLAMGKLKKDYEAGRVNKQELIQIQNKFRTSALQKKQEADQELAKLQGEFQADMKRGNVARAKSRLEEAIRKQKEAAQDAAKSALIGTLITSVTTITGAVVAGPTGADVGSAGGKVVNSILGY